MLEQFLSHWNLQTSGLTGGNFSLAATNDHLGIIPALGDLHLTLASSAVGTHQSATGTLTTPILNRSGLSSANLAQTLYASLSSVTLPLTWLSFDVSREGNIYDWSWKVGVEDNVARYIPQYSLDGVNYIDAGTVLPAGSNHNYDFIKIIPQSGTIYFRVLEADLDGKTDYSIIRSMAASPSPVPGLYPNPFTTELHIQWPYTDATKITLVISDAQGRMIHRQSTQASAQQNITVAGLPPGVYFIYCLDDKQRRSSTVSAIRKP